jgi:hypothetical protein
VDHGIVKRDAEPRPAVRAQAQALRLRSVGSARVSIAGPPAGRAMLLSWVAVGDGRITD